VTDAALQAAQAAVEAWRKRDAVGAERHAREWLELRPDDPNGLQVLAAARLHLGHAGEAAELLSRADAVAPNQPAILNMLGQSLRRVHRHDEARAALVRAAELGLPEAWRRLGELETEIGDFGAAVAAFERGVAAAPNVAAAHAALAYALEQRRDTARAKEHAERALALDASSQAARLTLAQIAISERNFADVHALLAPVRSSPATSANNRALALGLVGEAHDRQGESAPAFAAFAAANAILLQEYGHYRAAFTSPYHPEAIGRMTRYAQSADASGWVRAEAARAPAFLVGFPRSGTTLLDQILASHSRVVSIEEKDIFSPTVLEFAQDGAKLDALNDLSEADIAARRARYWAAAEAEAGGPVGDRVLLDKLPLNIAFLPLLARVFPNAHVIVALRDPRDVVLSCFQQRFGMNTAMAQFLDLESGARYYDQIMNLYLASRALPLRFCEVKYEDVVADLEGSARRLASSLELAFEPAMLNFTATAKQRDINTPSARQVIQPLYARSVGRWRRYAAEMAPVLPVLERWAAKWGYAV